MNKIDMLVQVRGADPEFIPSLARLYDIQRDSTEFERLINDVDAFCRSMAPVPVALRDPLTIKPLIDGFRKQQHASQRPTSFFVIFLDGKLFERIQDDVIRTTNSYNTCAAFDDIVKAREAGRKLDGITNSAIRISRITNEIRSPESISNTLTDFGF